MGKNFQIRRFRHESNPEPVRDEIGLTYLTF